MSLLGRSQTTRSRSLDRKSFEVCSEREHFNSSAVRLLSAFRTLGCSTRRWLAFLHRNEGVNLCSPPLTFELYDFPCLRSFVGSPEQRQHALKMALPAMPLGRHRSCGHSPRIFPRPGKWQGRCKFRRRADLMRSCLPLQTSTRFTIPCPTSSHSLDHPSGRYLCSSIRCAPCRMTDAPEDQRVIYRRAG